jgi:hypothetical protein
VAFIHREFFVRLDQPPRVIINLLPEAQRGFLPEFGGRVLRVVVNKTVVPERVVTVYFDRTMKGKL